MFSMCTLQMEPNVLQLHKGSTYIAKPPFTKPTFVISRGFNARMVSCGSREGPLGLCGASATEIVDTAGVVLCP